MAAARFRFYGELNDFLPTAWRQRCVEHAFDRRTSVKDMVEALGVPHPEVSLILCDGHGVGFDHIVRDGERFGVYPAFRSMPVPGCAADTGREPARFLLDANLGAVARNLRHCGFDTWYRNDITDDELAELAAQTDRIVLTRDRGALKRRLP